MKKFGYKCPECGKGIVKEKEILNYKTKIDNYPFIVPKAIIGICDTCGCKNFDPEERQRWVDLYRKHLEAQHISLTSEEISKIRKDLSLSMEKFANLIGCTRQSIYNWENIDRKIPQSRMVDLIITLIKENIYKGKINVVEFLVKEAKKVGIDIKLKEDIVLIVTSRESEGILHPTEEYSKNYKYSEEPFGFSPKLKIIT